VDGEIEMRLPLVGSVDAVASPPQASLDIPTLARTYSDYSGQHNVNVSSKSIDLHLFLGPFMTCIFPGAGTPVSYADVAGKTEIRLLLNVRTPSSRRVTPREPPNALVIVGVKPSQAADGVGRI